MYDILFAHLYFETNLGPLQKILPASGNRLITDVISARIERPTAPIASRIVEKGAHRIHTCLRIRLKRLETVLRIPHFDHEVRRSGKPPELFLERIRHLV